MMLLRTASNYTSVATHDLRRHLARRYEPNVEATSVVGSRCQAFSRSRRVRCLLDGRLSSATGQANLVELNEDRMGTARGRHRDFNVAEWRRVTRGDDDRRWAQTRDFRTARTSCKCQLRLSSRIRGSWHIRCEAIGARGKLAYSKR